MVTRSLAAAFASTLMLASLPSFASSSSEQSKAPTACGHRAAWTVAFYSNGDNDLQNQIINDLYEAAMVGSSPLPEQEPPAARSKLDLHILTLLDTRERYRGDGSFVIRVGKVTKSDWAVLPLSAWAGAVVEHAEANMAEGETLRAFLSETLKCYPADRVALIFNGHGSGARAGRGARTDGRSRAFALDLHPSLPATPPGVPEQPPDLLYVSEAVGAIKKALRENNAGDLALIGLDACLMSTVEVGYAFQQATSLLVASENIEGPSGWRHDLWLSKLAMNPLAEPAEVARFIVDSYEDGIKSLPPDIERTDLLENRTLAAIELGHVGGRTSCHEGIGGLAQALDKLGAALVRTHNAELPDKLVEARRDCRSFGPNSTEDEPNADLACIMSRFKERVVGLVRADATQDCTAVLAHTERILNSLSCMIADPSVGSSILKQKPFSGLSVFLPRNRAAAEDSIIWHDRDDRVEHPMPFFVETRAWNEMLVNVLR